ncbi:PREDICTED: protein N-lysine methyltransferase METTL20-like [Ceratosolen solmsi marchali]|uniref:ETFB lysine methyltransferase n=1 Tax=Ceratosolen solmsi marchali TaxID=326594 RepID=A0AAJ6YF18_9HYME|nr:PREDICTED: protein N-lysine methyltransferase METTL20-like [Ceratosolen solmsi marchali]
MQLQHRMFQRRVGRYLEKLCIENEIERHTKISREHLTPELQLHLLTPDCPLYTARETQIPRYFREPFWSIYWPGGQVLARYILDEGSRFLRGLSAAKVLDVGAGCGAAAIAAKIAGADDVLANDIDKVACVAAIKNAKLNGVKIRTSTNDLIGRELPENFDFVLIGDLLYDEIIATRLEDWLEKYVSNTENPLTEIYVADPGRHGLSDTLRRRLVHRRTYRLPKNVCRENYGYNEAAVWKYLPRS